MRESGRRLASSGVAIVIAALLLFLVPGGTVAAAPTPADGPSQGASLDSTGIVPDVMWWDVSPAVAAVQAAGFVAQTSPGYVDCGPPFVQNQNPDGGTTAVLGSTVILKINRQPAPGQPCP